MDAEAWHAIRPNLRTVAEAADWWAVIEGPVAAPVPTADDRSFLDMARAVCRGDRLGGRSVARADDPLKDETGRKGRALFLPLRLALTGRDHGPDMAALLPLIGRERAIERLRG